MFLQPKKCKNESHDKDRTKHWLKKLNTKSERNNIKDYEVRLADILEKLKWDNLSVRRYEHKAISVYKIVNDKAPNLKSLFKFNKANDLYQDFRDKNLKLSLPKPRTESLNTILGYSWAALWNDFPYKVRSENSLASFKRTLEHHCLKFKTSRKVLLSSLEKKISQHPTYIYRITIRYSYQVRCPNILNNVVFIKLQKGSDLVFLFVFKDSELAWFAISKWMTLIYLRVKV